MKEEQKTQRRKEGATEGDPGPNRESYFQKIAYPLVYRPDGGDAKCRIHRSTKPQAAAELDGRRSGAPEDDLRDSARLNAKDWHDRTIGRKGVYTSRCGAKFCPKQLSRFVFYSRGGSTKFAPTDPPIALSALACAPRR